MSEHTETARSTDTLLSIADDLQSILQRLNAYGAPLDLGIDPRYLSGAPTGAFWYAQESLRSTLAQLGDDLGARIFADVFDSGDAPSRLYARLTCAPGDLSARVEFDSPFRVWPGGVVTDAPADVYAPDVLDDYAPDGWEFATTGYTGQYGYNGPTMHSSEQLAGQLAADILAEPGVYVLTTSHATGDPVDVELSAEDIPDDFPVRPLGEFEPIGADIVTCGTCGLSWDDSVSTSRTPAPSGRCPFEAFHDYFDEDTAAGWVIVRQS